MQLTADGMPADPGRTPRRVRLAVGLLMLVALLAVDSLVLNGLVGWELNAERIRREFGAAVVHEMWVDSS